MAEIAKGVYHTVEGIVESVVAVFHTAFDVVYTFVHGVVMLLYNTIESFAAFIGASVQFVLSNIVMLVFVLVAFIVYSRHSSAAQTRSKGKKKLA